MRVVTVVPQSSANLSHQQTPRQEANYSTASSALSENKAESGFSFLTKTQYNAYTNTHSLTASISFISKILFQN